MMWHPQNLTASCPNANLTSCSLLGYFYLELLADLYGGSLYHGPEVDVSEEYDFIVVGAGAAGSVVARRLSEIEEWKILLLEAGPEQPEVTVIPGVTTALYGSNIDWSYSTQPDPNRTCSARPNGQCSWPRGKGMGGSTIINSMLYIRGHRLDYDEWAALGNEGWSYDEVLPYFKKSENNLNIQDLDSKYHRRGGLLSVSEYPFQDLPSNLTLQAFEELGIPLTDFNGAQQTGTGNSQTTTKEGLRVSAYTAFIKSVRNKSNLTVKPHSEAVKVLIDDRNTAYGVVFINKGKKQVVKAKKEVILCGGAINTPKLLMLSGIGPTKHVKKLGIKHVKDLPVGENLQDHATFTGIVIALSKETSTNVSGGEILRQVYDFKEAPLNQLSYDGAISVMTYYKTDPNISAPDVKFDLGGLNWEEFVIDPTNYDQTNILPSAFYNGLVIRPMAIKPNSRGHLLLNSTDPHGPPLIYPNYYSNGDHDMTTLLKGLKFLLKLENTNVFKTNGWRFVKTPLPACKDYTWGTEGYFKCLAYAYTTTAYHPVGTCKMGLEGDKAVVDPWLKVYGIDSLRVIDSSIMPAIPRGNTMAPTYMIAEKGADLVKEYHC